MEDCQKPLAIQAPATLAENTGTEVQVAPLAMHKAPTTVSISTPPTDLKDLIASIPAPVHI